MVVKRKIKERVKVIICVLCCLLIGIEIIILRSISIEAKTKKVVSISKTTSEVQGKGLTDQLDSDKINEEKSRISQETEKSKISTIPNQQNHLQPASSNQNLKTQKIQPSQIKSYQLSQKQVPIVKNQKATSPINNKKNQPLKSSKSILPIPKKTSPSVKTAVPPKSGNIVYLTFDDGPSKDTLSIVKTLNQYGAKATFFMLQPNMIKFQSAVKELAKEGEGLGLHGVTHDVHKIYQSPQTVVSEMSIAQNTLKQLTGFQTNLIRTPYGSYPYMKPNYMAAVQTAGFKLWDWTIDSEDWKSKNGEYVKNSINQLQHFPFKSKPKVILMHDKGTTLAHLSQLLNYLRANGYKYGVLNEQMAPYSQQSK